MPDRMNANMICEPAEGLKAIFDRQGFVGPFPLREPNCAHAVLELYQELSSNLNQHNQYSDIATLIRDASLLEKVEFTCGVDLVLWRTAFFEKSTGAAEIGWHHDKHFQDGEEPVSFIEIDTHFSVLIALSSISEQTGQIEIIPRSHIEDERYPRDSRPFHRRTGDEHFLEVSPALTETRLGLDIPAGHFIIFHSALLHRSLPHPGGPPRLGLALRLARAGLSIPSELPSDVVPFGRQTMAV